MPAPKPIYVKDLSTNRTRKFDSQSQADKFYNKKIGYFKDIKTKLGGKTKYFEVVEVAQFEEEQS